MGKPWGVIEFSQESGRAGRNDAQTSRSVLIFSDTEYTQLLKHDVRENLSGNEAGLRQFIWTTGCRSTVPSEYMDGLNMRMVLSGSEGGKVRFLWVKKD